MHFRPLRHVLISAWFCVYQIYFKVELNFVLAQLYSNLSLNKEDVLEMN